MDSDWKVTSKRTVLKNGKFCTVEYHTIELPGGRIIDDWTWIVTPDFVNALVVDAAGRREVEEELASGRIKVMPWAHNIALALLYLRRGEG